MIRNPVTCLALFFALAGTGLAAGRAITGRDVKDGSLTGADFRRHGLRADDVPRHFRGPRGPLGAQGPPGPIGVRRAPYGPVFDGAHATIGADGHVVDGAQMSFTHPAPGVYCLDNAPGYFLLVQSAEIDDPQIVAADRTGGTPCPSGYGARVAVFDRDGTPADGAFFVILT